MTDYTSRIMSGEEEAASPTTDRLVEDILGHRHHHSYNHHHRFAHPHPQHQTVDPPPPRPSSSSSAAIVAPAGGGGGAKPAATTFAGIPTQASMLQAVDKLKFFLATAPGHFDPSDVRAGTGTGSGSESAEEGAEGGDGTGEGGPRARGGGDAVVAREERCLNRFQLPTGELISCVLWNGLFHVTGTDIVRVLHFRFAAFGRPVRNPKKFEEGIFSDLRNLKSGTDATLEEPKSEFLELLFKYNCIRTQKKQKVFYWFSVPHDRLFLDALDRDLKREKLGVEPTTESVAEPALSFSYNPNKSLYDQFTEQQQQASSGEGGGEGRGEGAAAMAAVVGRSVQGGPKTDGSSSMDERRGRGHSRGGSGGGAGAGGSSSTARPARYPYHHRPASLTVEPSFVPLGQASSGLATEGPDGSQVVCLALGPPHPAPASAPASVEGGQMPFRSADSDGSSDVSTKHAADASTTGTTGGQRTFSDPSSASALFGAFALFEGSPTYKQRRKPGQQKKPSPLGGTGTGKVRTGRGSVDESPPRSMSLTSPTATAGTTTTTGTGTGTAATMNGRVGIGVGGGGVGYRTASSAAGLTLPALTAEPPPAPAAYFSQYQPYQGHHHHHHHQLAQPISPYNPHLALTMPSSSFLVGPAAAAAGGGGGGGGGGGTMDHGAIATPSVSAVDLAAAAASQVVLTSEDGQGQGKSYSCPLFSCGRLFKRYEHLKRHLRIHTEEKPYGCTKCDKRFARTDNLSAHLKIHEKMEALERQGSTSSADQRALDAEEEADERQSPSLTGAYEASPGPHAAAVASSSTAAGGGGRGQAPGFNEYYVGLQPGLPTPPIGPMDHPQHHHAHHPQHHPSSASSSSWGTGHHHQHHGAGHSTGWGQVAALLTPDPSPDPSSFYGGRQVHHGGGGAGGGDESRHSSIGSSTRATTTYLENGGGGEDGGSSSSSGEYAHAHAHHGYATAASPLMSSFQHQLSMVNSLNAEMQANEAASLLSFASSGGYPHHHQHHHPYPSHHPAGYLHPGPPAPGYPSSSTSPPPTSAGLLPIGTSSSSLSSSAGSSSAHPDHHHHHRLYHHPPGDGGGMYGSGDEHGPFRSVAAADFRGF